jgi:DNA-binding CsgD family transcriptional regulator
MKKTNRKSVILKFRNDPYSNWAGLETKKKLCHLLQKNSYTADELATILNLSPKTIVNAIGEIRTLNNMSKSSWAVLTDATETEYTYKLYLKSQLKKSAKLSKRVLNDSNVDNYFIAPKR